MQNEELEITSRGLYINSIVGFKELIPFMEQGARINLYGTKVKKFGCMTELAQG